MTIINDIRAILDDRLATTTDVPEIAFQNVPYTSTNGTTYLKPTLVPTSIRLASLGEGHQQLYRGFYNILVCVPEAEGVGVGYDLVDTLLARFPASQDLSIGGPYITIDYSEVGASFLDSPFYCTPITIGWYCYHS